MRRIVFVINSLVGGGAERVMTVLLRNSQHYLASYDVHLVLLDKEADAYPAPENVTVHRLDARRSLGSSVFQLGAILRGLRPDVVLSFLTRSNLSNVLCSIALGHKAIISERAQASGHHKGAGGAVSKLLLRALYPRAAKVIGVSGGVSDDLVANFAVRRDRVVSIPNPVDGDLVRARGAEAPAVEIEGPYVIGMGRFIGSKNFALLIDAFAGSRFSGLLVLLGDGPLRGALERQAVEKSVAGRVLFLGFQANPFAFIKRAEAFVLPSNGEGFPNSLVEAMALGVPVISTDCASGPSEILDDAKRADGGVLRRCRYGLLAPTNAVAPMTEAIDIATEPAMKAPLAAQALEGASRYDVEGTVRRYWREIEALLPSADAVTVSAERASVP